MSTSDPFDTGPSWPGLVSIHRPGRPPVDVTGGIDFIEVMPHGTPIDVIDLTCKPDGTVYVEAAYVTGPELNTCIIVPPEPKTDWVPATVHIPHVYDPVPAEVPDGQPGPRFSAARFTRQGIDSLLTSQPDPITFWPGQRYLRWAEGVDLELEQVDGSDITLIKPDPAGRYIIPLVWHLTIPDAVHPPATRRPRRPVRLLSAVRRVTTALFSPHGS